LSSSSIPLIRTIKEKCRVCYTCVRECPAKAIQVRDGQAEVIFDHCIGCGRCFNVCSQQAKEIRDSIQEVSELLKSEYKVVACVAPSVPAEFNDLDHKQFVGVLKTMGFAYVVEVAFGADLVSAKYKELFDKTTSETKGYISTTCPAIVSYVEKYYPELVKNLVPIASPMIAMAKVVHQKYGKNTKIVFIGPCLAKKDEASNFQGEEIDSVLTFAELRKMMKDQKIDFDSVPLLEFDPPHPGRGVTFPMGRGLIQSAALQEDLMTNDVISVNGSNGFLEIIKEHSKNGGMKTKLIDVLCCQDGCIMGPGFTRKRTQFNRHADVSKYAKSAYDKHDKHVWLSEMEIYKNIDLDVKFISDDKCLPLPSKEELIEILEKLGKFKPEDELNCGACGYETCVEHAIAIHSGIAEVQMCLPYTIERLKETTTELSKSYAQLENTQKALIQSEKLASMGQLAAGVAHEVNNPLGIVLLYAHLLLDEVDENSPNYCDLQMIVEQADRCRKIVGGLLNFARKNKVILKETSINELIINCLKGLSEPSNIEIIFDKDSKNVIGSIDPDQITQVLVNLISNAAEAMPDGGTISIITSEDEDNVIIKVKDTGIGIKESYLKKIFEPFFTTKQIGKGTGLGLAVTYGIIKMHKGQITVESNSYPEKGQTGTTFIVTLPKRESEININD